MEGSSERRVLIDERKWHHTSEHHNGSNIQNSRNEQSTDDSNGHITLGVLYFTSQGGDRIESNIREEYLTRSYKHCSESEGSEGLPVSSINVDGAKNDDEQNDSNVENGHNNVEST